MGVDIFFVISGFVIALISYGKPVGFEAARRFVVARAARVIPLYWVLTILFTTLLIFAPSAFGHARFSLWHVISSFLFIPSLNWVGIVVPVINVGWTLNYEIWFYALFTLAIAIFQQPTRFVLIALMALALVHPLCEGGIIWNFYTNSIMLEFAGGAILGTVYARYKNISPSIIIPLLPIVGVVIWYYGLRFTGETRFIALGFPAFLAVACALYFENHLRWNKFLCSLGDASYSLYLSHAFTIPVCMKFIQVVDQRHSLPGDLVCLLVIALSVAVAFACRRYLERPMTRVVRSRLDQPAIVQ